jgi:hypothetical protein
MNFSVIKSIAEKIRSANISEGLNVFSKSVQEFGDSMDKLTKELGTTSNKTKIWSEKKDDSQKIIDDMEKIWGKKK